MTVDPAGKRFEGALTALRLKDGPLQPLVLTCQELVISIPAQVSARTCEQQACGSEWVCSSGVQALWHTSLDLAEHAHRRSSQDRRHSALYARNRRRRAPRASSQALVAHSSSSPRTESRHAARRHGAVLARQTCKTLMTKSISLQNQTVHKTHVSAVAGGPQVIESKALALPSTQPDCALCLLQTRRVYARKLGSTADSHSLLGRVARQR